jgi:hypothetical protein
MIFVTMAQLAVNTKGFPPKNPDLLVAIENAHNATTTFTSSGGDVLAAINFDLSNKSSRDDLFHKAWTTASEAASAPTPCR